MGGPQRATTMPQTNGTNGTLHIGINSTGAAFTTGADVPTTNGTARTPASRTFETSRRVDSFGIHTTTPGGPTSRAQAKVSSYSDDPASSQKFPRISRPVELLRTEYDVLVIGSGYGGGVAASRMARAGQSVCLLERGKERWPGEYPSTLPESLKQLHVSGDFAPGFLKAGMVEGGDPTGLYHLVVGHGQNAFVGNGLGGTSLLNANVFLRTDSQTMTLPYWPDELKEPGALDEYYELAEHMLEPTPYPEDWPKLPKLSMLEKQANHLGMGEKFKRVPQTTRFMVGTNSTGVEMNASALTGQDCTGVNDGSKSSTLVNYLADAWNWGAEMFCECEVRYIRKHPHEEGYMVYFAWHGSGRGAFGNNIYEDLMWVHAKKCVFLGAGSLGTTEILLRSKEVGLNMSSTIGTGMSGNGDILAFGYNCNEEVNAMGREFPSPYRPVGPTITGVIDCREGHENPLDGFVIQEGAVPKALTPLFQIMLDLMPGKHAPTDLTVFDQVKHIFASVGSRFLGPYYPKGSIERTMVYLIMSHDSNQAILTLKNDKPILKFLGVGRSDHVEYLNDILSQATSAVGGTFINSPFYAALGQQEITVHPIGGANMSSNGTGSNGVTNHFGEVFTGNGSETHNGLVVTDGAAVPTALGVNPFATITALAERSVKHMADKMGAKIDYKTENGILDLFGAPKKSSFVEVSVIKAERLINETQAARVSGIGFSEIMSGYIHVGNHLEGGKKEDYEIAERTARGLCEQARFFLSVKSWNTETIIYRPDHTAMLTGTFVCAALKGSPFMVQRGDFQLFNSYLLSSGTKNLTYDFDMTATDGKKYHFRGYKTVDSSVALNPLAFWRATSTLYVTITRINGPVVARGILHIKPSDFLSEVLTVAPTGRNMLAKVQSTANFVTYFVKQAAEHFFIPFTSQQYPLHSYRGFSNPTPITETIQVTATDGVKCYMQMWEAQPDDPNLPVYDVLFIPGASVDHQIFSLQTIEKNAVQYFTKAGYRVWVIVHRIGMTMQAEKHWTTFDARLDIRAALNHIRKVKGPQKIYTVAHCMGSVAFSCGLLDGTIPAEWIKGISCSQVFMNPKWATLNMLKVLSPLPIDRIYNAILGNWFSCTSTPDDSYFQQAINQVLRFYPDIPAEWCNNVACHRGSFIFGRMWNHRNLNEATHRQINRFFGGVNMTLEHLLMQSGKKGYVTTNYPLAQKLTTAKNLRRLKGIPIFLFSGSDNKVLTPESTDITYSILRDTFGSTDYERRVVEGYGHLDCWMGVNAHKDVFPMIRERIDRVVRGEEYIYQE